MSMECIEPANQSEGSVHLEKYSARLFSFLSSSRVATITKPQKQSMADSELDEIRAKRLAQLRSQYGEGGNAQEAEAQERQNQANEVKNSILSQILDQSARARLNTLMIGKPEKGKMVENMLLQMAQSGRLAGKITEQELIGILENVNRQTSKTTTVKFDRRRAALDDSDDDL